MQQNFDQYSFPEIPAITLCNPNREEIFSLGLAYDRNIIIRFSGMSEFSFVFPQSIDGGETTLEAYSFLNNKRLVLVDGYGYFQIVDVEEELDGSVAVKKVSCLSAENELVSKRVVAFGGTRPLYSLTSPENTILKEMSDLCGGLWTVGTVDSRLLSLQRTFDVRDSNIYEFLMGEVSKAFDCVFIFNTVNRTISAKAVATATTQTDIFLSFDNVIKSATFSEKSDEITTVLEVRGGGDLGINSVNPLGTNKIYDFSYYMNTNWMSSGLISAIQIWEALVDKNQLVYSSTLLQIEQDNASLIVLRSELATLQAEYLALEGVQKVRIQQGVPYADITAQMVSKQNQITAKNVEIQNKTANITSNQTILTNISNGVSLANNFTTNQLLELQNFMFENTYLNSNIVQTDNMTLVEIQQAEYQLYNQGTAVLAKVAQPRYEFTLDSINYIAIPEFETTFTAQTQPGCIVTAELESGVFIEAVLLELSFSFDDPSGFKLTFSNRLRLDGAGYSYSDLLGEIKKTGSSVAFDDYKWSNWDNEYKGSVTEFITSALNTANNQLINSDNQEIVINQNGLRGKTYVPETETYDPNQVWLTSSVLAFSDDGFLTSKLALGKVTLAGEEKFGIVADAIVGELIIGSSLLISNESATFIVDGDGATLHNAAFTVENADTKIIIDPTDGATVKPFRIQRFEGGEWVDRFLVDEFGNVKFSGDLTGSSGTFSGNLSSNTGDFGGMILDALGLHTEDGNNHLYNDGRLKWGLLTTTATTATFNGTIYAANLRDNIEASVFTAAGIMSGDRIYAGRIIGPGMYIDLDNIGYPTIDGETGVIITSNLGAGAGYIAVLATGETILRGSDVGINALNDIQLNPAHDLELLAGNILTIQANDVFITSLVNDILLTSTGDIDLVASTINVTGDVSFVTTSSLHLPSGDITLSNGDVDLDNGNVILSGGQLQMTGGSIALNSTDINLTTDGTILLDNGFLVIKFGGITMGGDGDDNLSIASSGLIQTVGNIQALGYYAGLDAGLTTTVGTMHFKGGILIGVS